MMATQVSHSVLLENLTESLLSTIECTERFNTFSSVQDGISLLDIKNEIFLSYLHNLVFFILVKLRNLKNHGIEADSSLDDLIVKKLVESQIYINKSVRPLENRLKYQIEKVLRAADDAKLVEDVKAVTNNQPPISSKIRTRENSEEESDGEESRESDDDESEKNLNQINPEINDLQYKPNPAAFLKPKAVPSSTQTKENNDSEFNKDKLYKPPRIYATSMTMTGPRDSKVKKPGKSSTLDEFIYTEMSTAPIAEPSIGSTILGGGRSNKTERERILDRERIDYEERNYTRLPKESKKELAKKKAHRKDIGYGGEDWRGLGDEIDRIERLTRKSGKKSTPLEKSRKRPKEETNVDGYEIGQDFRKRLKSLGKGKRNRGR